MNAKQRCAIRKELTALAARLTGDVTHLKEDALQATGGETSGGLSDYPVHPADLAGRAYEEEVAVSLVRQEEDLLAEVNAALERLDQGTYGRCATCGVAIAAARLQALPYARRCVSCACKS